MEIPPTPPQCHYGEEIHLFSLYYCFLWQPTPHSLLQSADRRSIPRWPHRLDNKHIFQLDLDYCSEEPGAFRDLYDCSVNLDRPSSQTRRSVMRDEERERKPEMNEFFINISNRLALDLSFLWWCMQLINVSIKSNMTNSRKHIYWHLCFL